MLKKENGDLALNNQENCKILAKYFENRLNCPEPTNKFPFQDKTKTNSKSNETDEIEIKPQIKRLKNNKASEEDGIVAALLKSAGPKTVREITQVI